MGRFGLTLLGAVLVAAVVRGDDSVVNSKHDLSTFGPGPVRAINEDRVCIFCHVPHNASPVAPLWNRHSPTSYYRVYRSSTLDARTDQPGPQSKLCLSCHDGSIALGLTLDRPATDPIPMSHVYMPFGEANLTNDLSDDHPIGFRYDRALANRDSQIRPPELVDHRLPLGPRNELECTACHDPHDNELGSFLRVTDREGALCTTCHELDGWRTSAHATSGQPVSPTVTRGEPLPYNALRDNACRACHRSHSAPYRDRLLYDRPSQLCLNCHDGMGGPDILGALDQHSGHRINRFAGHERGPEDRLHISRYVECTDCHNPHAAASDGVMARGPANSEGPLVPAAMRHVAGITLAGVPIDRARFYYEVCFQCHADRPVLVRDRIVRDRDSGGNIRRQILPTAASAHPIAFPVRRSSEVPSLTPGYRARQMIGCQECHNNPDASGVGGLQANGPHGSRFDYLLAARYETRDFTIESPQAYALCYGCHERTSILNNESFPLHERHVVRGRTPCSACHTPHGVSGAASQHGHLINFDLSIVGGRRFFNDTGRFRGTCTLRCHGVDHVNFIYEP